ncbi:unnamed protein product, partial [Ectocarpus sp. 6 AP-2014]
PGPGRGAREAGERRPRHEGFPSTQERHGRDDQVRARKHQAVQEAVSVLCGEPRLEAGLRQARQGLPAAERHRNSRGARGAFERRRGGEGERAHESDGRHQRSRRINPRARGARWEQERRRRRLLLFV